MGEGDFRSGRLTFCGVGGFIVFCEPCEVFVFNPWHPGFVLAVVEVAGLLLVGLRLCGFVLVGRHLISLSFFL